MNKKKKEYDEWTKKYEDYLKWCEDNNKKLSALNHLKYKFRIETDTSFPWMRSKTPTNSSETPEAKQDEDNKTKGGANESAEKGKEPKQQEQVQSADAADGATSNKSEPATEQPATEVPKPGQVSKDEQPQTSAQLTTADAATNTVVAAKDESNDAQDTVEADGDEVKATPLTLEQEIEELKKKIAILTMKIGDGVKET